jgi:phospholipase C
MLRMYDRYRLDNTRVLPYGEKGEHFEARALAGQLPHVVFIEPKITGIPPLEQASDDHPPANILRGQEFLENLVRIMRASPHWAKSMLVITYDEHGGFYDHMPPPGTPLGGAEWLMPDPDDSTRTVGRFAKLHPEGARHLGPRVPTFIVSPFVQPGTVSHAVFDHTTVLKSILVRHRAKIRRSIFAMFGGRVAQINHLGEALNKPVPDGLEVATMMAPMGKRRTKQNFGDAPTQPTTLGSLPSEARQGRDEVTYGFTLARAMMPKPRRT